MSNGGLFERIRNPFKPSKPALGWRKFLCCAMNIAQIVFGVIYLDDCPRQPNIPFYLIWIGVLGLVVAELFCLCINKTSDDDTSNPIIRLCTALNSLIACFLFCWFITGSVWIFSIYEPNYNKNTTNGDPYCNKTLYLFAFRSTILGHILLGPIVVYQIYCRSIYRGTCEKKSKVLDLLCTKVLTMIYNNLTVGFVMNRVNYEEREEREVLFFFFKVKERKEPEGDNKEEDMQQKHHVP